jgi:uncharacterized repeat protein (TIGR03803 family)
MRAFQLVICCALLAGCTRNTSSLPNTLSNEDAPPSRASQNSHTSIAREQHFKDLYEFKGIAGGAEPRSGLAAAHGELYGTTWSGGAYGYGTVFEMSTSGTKRVVYSFKAPGNPFGGLLALNGKLYGTTQSAVFEVSPSGDEHVLHQFNGAPDGARFSDGTTLIAVNGKLYGTTYGGGSTSRFCQPNGGCGTVFELSTSGEERVLYRFKGHADGTGPYAGLVAFKGKLYGTTWAGGTGRGGTVFEVSMSGKERVLYEFKRKPDASGPYGKLITLNGKLYGGTLAGGKYDSGAFFELSTSGNEERVLHSFTFKDGQGVNGLTLLGGKIYGTTGGGGPSDGGTLFEMSASGEEHRLHTFKQYSWPVGELVALHGVLYGATEDGGSRTCSAIDAYACGTVFEFSP